MNRIVALTAAASFLLAMAGVELVRRWASRNLLDIPNERSSHRVPTPRGGGIALAAVFFAAIAFLQIQQTLFTPVRFAAYMAACAVVVIISWIDDLRGVANRWRFLVHWVAAGVICAAFGPLASFRLFSFDLRNDIVGWVVSLLWVVGLINAFNFMDGIDGIASVQAIVAAAAWFMIGPEPVRSVALLLAAVTAGFLVHNWHPARIFIGDVGSALLGLVIASMPLIGRGVTDAEWIAVLSVWPFVFDTAFTLVRRLRRGENVFMAHRSHLYQRLVIAGLSQASVTAIYGLLAAAGAILGWGISSDRIADLPAVVIVFLLASGLWALTVFRERSLDRR